MRIIIETTGGLDSKISINGTPLEDCLKEFSITLKALKPPKLQMIKEVNGKPEYISYYGGDFAKYDEVNPTKKEN